MDIFKAIGNRAATIPNSSPQIRGRNPQQKIPRPPNAFMIFANEWRRKLAQQNPRESNKEISVRLGGMWKGMAQEIKDRYFTLARQVDAEHKRKYPDYVYNPKEARIRKAMRDQANRARNFHQPSQRQQQHFHQVTHHQHNRHSMRMEPRNIIGTQARIGSIHDQTSSLNIQQNQKISHVVLSPHVVQHKPRHLQMQQVNHGVGEGNNQQWFIGLNHRNAPQFSQQDFHRIQEQEMEKKRASIREQVEHGMVDSGFDFVVTGTNIGINNRDNVENRGTVTSQVNIPKGQEFDIFTDVDGRQHWYPLAQTGDSKVYNVTTENSWIEHQQQVDQVQQTHLQHENHSIKPTDQQQLFSLPCLVETESSSAQGKAEQNSHHNFQRIITIPPSEMQCNEEESFNGQQYIICSSTMTHPQVRFSIQPHSEALQSSTLNNVWQPHERTIHQSRGEKEEVHGQFFGVQSQQMEITKEDKSFRDSYETSSTDSASSTVKAKTNSSISNHEEIGQRNPNMLPLPAFQQAFGSTEIGRFANEGFLSQSPVAPNWSDPSSTYGLPSPTSASKPNGVYFFSLPVREEIPSNQSISFASSGYFDCSLREDIDGPEESDYGDLLGFGESPGFDFSSLPQDGDPFTSASYTDQDSGETIL